MAAMTGWVFAATMMIVVGVFQIIDGITAIFKDQFYVNVRNYTFSLDTTAWGWIHVALGALILLTGVFLMSGRTWAAVTGLVLASLSAINNFFFLPYYPLWAILVIAADVFVIWALARMLSAGATSGRDSWVSPAVPADGAPMAGNEPTGYGTPAGTSAATDVKPRTTAEPEMRGDQPTGMRGGAEQPGGEPDAPRG
ncbi:hypothetical protein GCM10022220_21370 [Actinocatenispora rupis]|uniref:DUF7144 domain-containing protein n=2 Tax=Actinocatenispora rupis TaxID=519421 RepID=A0A8J3NDL5_9ACTN|nr:hypothetical protein Aru02nite_39460 [Actinocatenispora rupis]